MSDECCCGDEDQQCCRAVDCNDSETFIEYECSEGTLVNDTVQFGEGCYSVTEVDVACSDDGSTLPSPDEECESCEECPCDDVPCDPGKEPNSFGVTIEGFGTHPTGSLMSNVNEIHFRFTDPPLKWVSTIDDPHGRILNECREPNDSQWLYHQWFSFRDPSGANAAWLVEFNKPQPIWPIVVYRNKKLVPERCEGTFETGVVCDSEIVESGISPIYMTVGAGMDPKHCCIVDEDTDYNVGASVRDPTFPQFGVGWGKIITVPAGQSIKDFMPVTIDLDREFYRATNNKNGLLNYPTTFGVGAFEDCFMAQPFSLPDNVTATITLNCNDEP